MDWAKLFQSKEKMRVILILVLIGILLMVLPMFGGQKEKTGSTARTVPNTTVSEKISANDAGLIQAEKMMEKNLQEILTKIEGAGEVSVRVSLSSTSEIEYAVNTITNSKKTEEKDPQGGSRIITETNDNGQLVLLRESGSSGENPVVVKEIKPAVEGVVVVSSGASDIAIKARILQAVQTFFNISSHRIAVLPGAGGIQ